MFELGTRTAARVAVFFHPPLFFPTNLLFELSDVRQGLSFSQSQHDASQSERNNPQRASDCVSKPHMSGRVYSGGDGGIVKSL